MKTAAEIRATIAALTAERAALVDTSSSDPAVARLAGAALRQQRARSDAHMRRYTELTAVTIGAWEHSLRIAEAREARAARKAAPLTRADVIGATHIRTSTGWWTVVRVNPKSVTVESGHSWADRVPYPTIIEYRTVEPGQVEA